MEWEGREIWRRVREGRRDEWFSFSDFDRIRKLLQLIHLTRKTISLGPGLCHLHLNSPGRIAQLCHPLRIATIKFMEGDGECATPVSCEEGGELGTVGGDDDKVRGDVVHGGSGIGNLGSKIC